MRGLCGEIIWWLRDYVVEVVVRLYGILVVVIAAGKGSICGGGEGFTYSAG